MATIERYVNTASSAGGNGTTNSTAGGDANRAYVSLNAAQAAEAKNLVTATDTIIFWCSGSSADTTAVAWSTSWVCNSTYYITVRPYTGQEHTGTWNTGVYRQEVTNASANSLPLYGSNTVFVCYFEHMQVKASSTSGSGTVYAAARCTDPEVVSSTFEFRHSIIQIADTGGTNITCVFYSGGANGPTWRARSCFLIGTPGDTVWYRDVNSRNCTLWANTIYGFTHLCNLLTTTGGTLTAQSNIVDGVTAWLTGTGSATYTGDYNVTSYSSTLTAGGNDRTSQDPTYVNEGGSDFHLSPSDTTSKGYGDDSLYSSFTYDIDTIPWGTNVTRPVANWDAGADQITFPSAAHKLAGKLYGKLSGKV